MPSIFPLCSSRAGSKLLASCPQAATAECPKALKGLSSLSLACFLVGVLLPFSRWSTDTKKPHERPPSLSVLRIQENEGLPPSPGGVSPVSLPVHLALAATEIAPLGRATTPLPARRSVRFPVLSDFSKASCEGLCNPAHL